ncbi:MAG: DUF4834 family protein [Prolixibacteraceae bacterium]|jgi:hypothetical protein|nr:DUF4834 family protein [Prolixibacteraceae bacterium]MBT6004183.1 DUF4834 family protein [Prolixibacteraceae bacterium]MBT6765257.1 DUF4834 family protein [Prolixibacteraceae bacterium]MBT6999395.1 DUF4834 family protein [Prolixibacteraceae bacterium]MBT7395227.1 DUF4834 family protein [Prolixibacteraceae bacterium]
MNLFIILYLVGFVRTLFVIGIIYFGIRIISRYILPLLVEKGVKNMQQKMNDQQKQNQRNSRTEGDVTIEHDKKNNPNHKNNQGDYIDFEEVD